jgi:hypothetical protein
VYRDFVVTSRLSDRYAQPTRFAAVFVIVAALAGCGGAKSPVNGTAADGMSEFAREVLSDGTVTNAEIEDSRARTISCIESEGFSASFVAQDDRVSSLEVDSGTPEPGESEADFETRFDNTIERCRGEFLDQVEAAWLQETAPSEEELRAAFAALQQCVEPYVAVLSADADGLAPLFAALDDPSTPDDARTTMAACYSDYTVAAASGDETSG